MPTLNVNELLLCPCYTLLCSYYVSIVSIDVFRTRKRSLLRDIKTPRSVLKKEAAIAECFTCSNDVLPGVLRP